VTPLAEKLAARIRANGPITVAEYMAACLGDPDHGYYMRREPFGRSGDFVTAPEVSQMFGELIGAWCVATWEAMGAPTPFVLAELGPGRGTLMADLLRAARIRPRFIDGARVHLVEMSPRLRGVQRVQLTQSAERLAWVDRVEDLPAGPAILVANEFFDALPIRQFARTPDGWAERMVGLGQDGELAFGLRPTHQPLPNLPSATYRSDDDAAPALHQTRLPVVEISPARTAVVHAVAERLASGGGAALVIDYGYEGPASGDTLQAVRDHQYDDPLTAPGEADMTAHVDFAALGQAARAAGAAPRSLLNQSEFLYRLGLAERASELSRGKDAETASAIAAAVERLAGRASMGKLFKVLALSSPALALPVFDDKSVERGP
jgi:NADH dehydrogenase [ubiquinone] 1 alpha subcomplex assembly factor 7